MCGPAERRDTRRFASVGRAAHADHQHRDVIDADGRSERNAIWRESGACAKKKSQPRALGWKRHQHFGREFWTVFDHTKSATSIVVRLCGLTPVVASYQSAMALVLGLLRA